MCIRDRFSFVTIHTCDRQTDGQNYDSQDRARICSRSKNKLQWLCVGVIFSWKGLMKLNRAKTLNQGTDLFEYKLNLKQFASAFGDLVAQAVRNEMVVSLNGPCVSTATG